MAEGGSRPENRPYAVEAVASAVAAGVAAVADPLLGIVTGGVIAYANNVIAQSWVAAASARLETEGLVFDPDDPALIAVYNRLTIGALQTSRSDKRRMLSDALAGSVRGETPDFLQEVFADLAVRYVPEHIGYLRLIQAPGDVLRSYGLVPDGSHTIGDALEHLLAGVEERDLVADKIGDDLYRDGLTRSRFGPEMEALALGPHELTARGQCFIDYLRPPGA